LDALKCIKTRRSIRKYANKKIPKSLLHEIVDCGRLAPSARNRQPWEFIVVTDKEKLKKLSKICTYGKHIKDAAACIIVCGYLNKKYVVEDCCVASENILLAANALGIGSCWIAGKGKDYSKEVSSLLKVPEGIEVITLIALGYPAELASMPKKRSTEEVIHWESF